MVVLDLSEEESEGGGDTMKGPWKSPISGFLGEGERKLRQEQVGLGNNQNMLLTTRHQSK